MTNFCSYTSLPEAASSKCFFQWTYKWGYCIHRINGMMTDVYEGVHGHWGYFKDSWMADCLFHGESDDMANLGVHPIQETSICSDSFELIYEAIEVIRSIISPSL